MPPEHEIRAAEPSDTQAILSLVRAANQEGDAFPWDSDASDEELELYWLPEPRLRCETFVCHPPGAARRVVGAFVLHPCSGGRVGHVAQGSFVVEPGLRGRGLGRRLCERLLQRAGERGFSSVHFKMVVSTNAAALRACEACGFEIAGTAPRSFNHPRKGLVDTHFMCRDLDCAEGGRRLLAAAVRSTPTPQSACSGSPPLEESADADDPAPVHISEAFADQLEKADSLVQLRRLEEPTKARAYGDWMMWMVHRAWLDDPELEELNFDGKSMPDGHVERRIAPKLMQAVGSNTHMRVLSLSNSNVQKAQGTELAESLKRNRTLRVVNLENNRLDSEAVRALAQAVGDNEGCAIEQLRFTNQRQGARFGRPTEQAVGQMMERNGTVVKLGFECYDPNWRNTIDRALVRNNDAYRRRQAAADQEECLPTSQELTLGQLLLEAAPAALVSEVFPENTPAHELYRSCVVLSRKLPTCSQLLSCASNGGEPLQYTTAGPLVKACRARALEAAVGAEVLVTDAFGVSKPGVMERWSEANGSWSIELAALEGGERYAFRSSKEPAFAVSEAWARWLEQSTP